MARGGIRLGPDGKPLQGRKVGSKSRTTLERENAALAEVVRRRQAVKTDLDVLQEIRDFWMGSAAREIKKAAKEKREPDASIIARAHDIAGAMAAKRAPFVHAKLSSVTVREDILDIARLDDRELAELARLREKASVAGSDPGRAAATQH